MRQPATYKFLISRREKGPKVLKKARKNIGPETTNFVGCCSFGPIIIACHNVHAPLSSTFVYRWCFMKYVIYEVV